MDTRTYCCTDPQLATLEHELARHGLTVDLSKDGEATQGKWDISWHLIDSTHISVTVKNHPFAQEGFFFSKLESIFGGTTC